MKYFLSNYKMIVDNEATEKEYDVTYISRGFVFDKKLTSDDAKVFIKTYPTIDKLNVLFDKNINDEADKMIRVALEYLLYNIDIPKVWRNYERTTSNIQLIKVVNEKEFVEFVNGLLSMDKAYPIEFLSEIRHYVTLPLEEIKNKEMQAIFTMEAIVNYEKVSGYLLVRCMNYMLTGNSLFIQKRKGYKINSYKEENALTGFKPKIADIDLIIRILFDHDHVTELAKYYNTYRDTFVAMKKYLHSEYPEYKFNREFNKIFNRYVRKNKVKQVDLSVQYDIDILKRGTDTDIKNHISTLSLKSLLKLYSILISDEYYIQKKMKPYHIRNGKTWIDTNFTTEYKTSIPLCSMFIYEALRKRVNELKEKEGLESIVFPKEHMSPLIFSDKRRVAGIYYGSGIKVKEGWSIGIEWQTNADIDLHAMSYPRTEPDKSENVGWCYDTCNNMLSYSGDCRIAGDEYITLKTDPRDIRAFFHMNLYSGHQDLPFRIFIMDENNKLIFQSEEIFFPPEKRSMCYGYIKKDGYFVLDLFSMTKDTVGINIGEHWDDTVEVNIADLFINTSGIFLEELFDIAGIQYEKLSQNEINRRNLKIITNLI